MKKVIILIILLISFNGFSQKNSKFHKNHLIKKAIDSAEKYLYKIEDKALYTKYFEVDYSRSTALFNMTFQNITSDSIYMKEVIGYIIEIKCKDGISDYEQGDLSFTLYLNKKFEVDYSEEWNSLDWASVQGNLTIKYGVLPQKYKEIFIHSLFDFAKVIDSKKLLSKTVILDALKEKYPTVKWEDPKISRGNMPPYRVTIEVEEKKCTQCEQLLLATDTLKIVAHNIVHKIKL